MILINLNDDFDLEKLKKELKIDDKDSNNIPLKETSIKDNVFGQFGSNIQLDDIIEFIENQYKEKWESEKEVFNLQHKKEIEELLKKVKQLEKYQPIEDKDVNKEAFPDEWHKNIKKVRVEYYYLNTMNEEEECGYCLAFIEHGYLDDLTSLYKIINLPKSKYELNIWKVDHCNRYLNNESHEKYDDNNTIEGLNWFYCRGSLINKFPAMDIFIEFINEPKTVLNTFRRIQGLGEKSGKVYLFRFRDEIKNLFMDFDASKKLDFSTHRAEEYVNDPYFEKRVEENS